MNTAPSRVALLLLAVVGSASAQAPAQPRYIDLAADAVRQVVLDRQAGQYIGHPTTVLLEDGKTMIAVYPLGHGKGSILMKRSSDGGRTWSDRLPVPASWATSQETPTIHRAIGPDGRKRLIVFSGLYPIRAASSEDDGRTWTELEPIGPFGGIVAMSSVVPLKLGRGHYMALFHDDGRFIKEGSSRATPPVFTLYSSRSIDGGMTWSLPRAIYASSELHLCEPGAVRSPDGKTIAMLLRENSRRKRSHLMLSTDEGVTWSEPKELPAWLTGDRHVAAYAPDGRLFVTFRDTLRDSPTAGDWLAWVGTWKDLVSGAPGQYRVRLMDNHSAWDCCYPGLEVLRDGTIVTTTYGSWTKDGPPYVVSVRLALKELDARR